MKKALYLTLACLASTLIAISAQAEKASAHKIKVQEPDNPVLVKISDKLVDAVQSGKLHWEKMGDAYVLVGPDGPVILPLPGEDASMYVGVIPSSASQPKTNAAASNGTCGGPEKVVATQKFWQASFYDNMSALMYWAGFGPWVNWAPAPDDDDGSNTPLCNAASNNDQEMLDYIYSLGGSVYPTCEYGNTALCFAVWNNNPNMTADLIQKGSPATVTCSKYGDNNEQTIPTCISASQNGTAVTGELVKANATTNSVCDDYNNTPVCYGAQFNNTIMTQMLIQGGANYNVTCKDDNTLICYAAKYNNQPLVNTFLNLGMDVVVDCEDDDDESYTPLCYAAQNNNTQMLNQFLARGAAQQINNECDSDKTALYFAARNNNLNMTETLGNAGANPNIGESSLIEASCAYDNYAMAEYLVDELGANVNATSNHYSVYNDNGDLYGVECDWTCCPLGCAQEYNDTAMVELLENYYAQDCDDDE
ncbi:MAG: hypothetical protein Tsb0018_08270 [Opitutales bacterium]